MLSGLSSAQYHWQWAPSQDGEADGWTVSPYLDEVHIYEDNDRVAAIHPVYAIPQRSVDGVKRYFSGKPGFRTHEEEIALAAANKPLVQ